MRSIELSGLDLNPSGQLRRSPPRPAHQQQREYEKEFEFHTVFYDCFASANGEWTILVGPPLSNLEMTVVHAVRDAFGKSVPPDFIVRNMDRHSQIWMRTAQTKICISSGIFVQDHMVVQPNHSSPFAGKRVLLTKSRDNDLRWIYDWALFHARKHGCNAVLLYDNGSTRYGTSEIRETLHSVEGLDLAVVVDWRYKFGPQDGESKIWDSDFCQYGIMEHARHRFLDSADAIVNADIDELVLTENGESVFDLALQSKTGYLRYRGTWIESACTGDVRHERRHVDFAYTSRLVSPPKWTVAAQRCPLRRQWRIHDIQGMDVDTELSNAVSYRHFRAVNTGWRDPRRGVTGPPGSEYTLDEQLAVWMRVFGV